MCQNSSKPVFEKAVRIIVEEFIQQGKKFSAYDVTKLLRERVNAAPVMASAAGIEAETGTVHVQGQAVARIEHDAVRDVVRTIYNNQEMAGYECNYNGTYFEYQPATTKAVLPLDPDPAAPDPATPAPATGGNYDGSPTL